MLGTQLIRRLNLRLDSLPRCLLVERICKVRVILRVI